MAKGVSADAPSHPIFARPVNRQRYLDATGTAVTGMTVVTTRGGAVSVREPRVRPDPLDGGRWLNGGAG